MEPKNHLDHPLQTCGQIYFNIFHQKLFYSGQHKVHQKQKLFREQYALDYLWPSLGMVGNAETPRKKCFFQKMCQNRSASVFHTLVRSDKERNIGPYQSYLARRMRRRERRMPRRLVTQPDHWRKGSRIRRRRGSSWIVRRILRPMEIRVQDIYIINTGKSSCHTIAALGEAISTKVLTSLGNCMEEQLKQKYC